MSLRYSFRKNQQGTSAIEFAFTAPIFMILIFVIIDAGLALWTQFGLENGVEAAARCAVVTPTTCASQANIQSYAAANSLGITVPGSTFTFTLASCGDQVSASYPYAFYSRYLGAPSITLTAASCFPDAKRSHSSTG
ncbi:MAG TPA: TadE/TadG family type IV pilus assembly protein [Rhizomicrobium sp.]|jgi:Flp pilus assembly protein TadG|nr:TadE/TadG family type IV pilus assembly protein [Rhizomicrobium sp.]